MLTKILSSNRLWLLTVILITSVFCFAVFSQSQDRKTAGKKINQKGVADKEKKAKEQFDKAGDKAGNDVKSGKAMKSVESANQNDRADSAEEMRMRTAQNIVRDVFQMSDNLSNPVVRTKVKMLVASAYWNFEPNTAKEILTNEFPKIASINIPQHELEIGKIRSAKELNKAPSYKGRELEKVKEQLRREMLAIASACDPALAKLLVASERKEGRDGHIGEEGRQDEIQLSAVVEMIKSDPKAAASIIRESSKTSISNEFPFLLMKLREQSPAEASAIFNQAFSVVRTGGDILDFQKLIPYILPTEKERLIGGKHYMTDPQRMKDTVTFIEYAIVLLSSRVESTPPTNMAPELVTRELYMWRYLLPVFKDLKPESLGLLNARISQLSESLPQSAQVPGQGPWSDEQLRKLIAAAGASIGEKRDNYLEMAAFAAWRAGQGDFDQAISLAEKIENKESRDLSIGIICFQAGLKALHNEGPDKALKLADKIKSPINRVGLYANIVKALHSAKSIEQADVLQEELLVWLRNCESTTDTAWGVLDYLDKLSNDNTERGFAALDIVVNVLNKASLDPPSKALKGKIYWCPEFHDFRKTLAPLARMNFERGLQTIQMLQNQDAAMLIQASFCGEYLKMLNESKKPPAKPRP